MKSRIWFRSVLFLMAAVAFVAATLPASGQDRGALEADAKRAYDNLIAQVPAANALNKDAVAVLVFPKIVKAGFMIGAQTGNGVLFRGGRAAGYYNTSGASYGLQAGAEEFGNAMFFMNEKALKALTESDGFEVGVGPSVTVVDEGFAKSMSTMTMKDDVYAFIFGQKGLMAGVGVKGNKITRLSN